MTIERIINGRKIQIELTEREMLDAYWEQEHEFDKEDVRAIIDDMDEDKLPEGVTESRIEEAARRARKWIDANDIIGDIRWECLNDAIWHGQTMPMV